MEMKWNRVETGEWSHGEWSHRGRVMMMELWRWSYGDRVMEGDRRTERCNVGGLLSKRCCGTGR